jgi:hypothetical protein
MPNTLGRSLFVTGWCVECRLTPQAVEAALMHIVEQIRMDTGGMDAQVWRFPIAGKGGAGVTAVQPLVESFNLGFLPAGAVIGDTWTDHDHCYFIVASCRPYDTRQVGDWLNSFVGRIISFGNFDLAGNRR